MRRTAVVLLAVAAGALLLSTSSLSSGDPSSAAGTRRLQAVGDIYYQGRVIRWGAKHTAALVLSVLVALTSSVDRECGASLYVVLYAVLLNMPFRRAAAMTAFTIALGALGPGIAGMSEPHLTERGVLPVVDYPGALVLLPTMFWGISFGVIVNLWFPNWLLCLIWVIFVLLNTIELLVSCVMYLKVEREARGITNQFKQLTQGPAAAPAPAAAAAEGGISGTAIELAAGSASGSTLQLMPPSQQQQQAEDGVGRESHEQVQRQQQQLLNRAHQLAKRAHRIEARALLYPTLYVPDVARVLQKANIHTRPCELRATATPSCIGAMDFEQQHLSAELGSYQQVFGRFTFSWGKWWKLNRLHFELMLVLKVVVLHLVTEAVRHHMSKPCTMRFWLMLVVMTGLVTAFLMFVVTSYGRRRLWRGRHWVDALNQVRQVKKAEQQQELQRLQELGGAGIEGEGAAGSGGKGVGGSITAAAAAVSAGEAVAVRVPVSTNSSHDGVVVVPEDGAAAAGAAEAAAGGLGSLQQQQQGVDEEGQQKQPGCWGRFKKRLPWVWVPATDAVSNISYCNSVNQYQKWGVPIILVLAVLMLPVGIFGCALGLPCGPMMAHMLLALGLKPDVVAATSRFLVLCFTFGSFVAHIIAGGLEPTLALAFGLINLALAPLGMFLFTKFKPRGAFVIGLSLFMGVVGVVVVVVWQLVPLLADLAAIHTGDPTVLALRSVHDVAASVMHQGNLFDLNRFCKKEHL